MMDNNGSLTARMCLFARAVHAQEENPVFNDTKAEELLDQKDYEAFSNHTRKTAVLEERIPVTDRYDERLICRQVDCYLSPILASRSSFTEECVSRFSRKYGSIQYVILGAGMDTFAFRNQNPLVETYELDHPFTQNYKIRKIQELGWKIPDNLHYTQIDFTKNRISETLKKTSFDPLKPTVFSILGLTYYLSEETFSSMLKEISSVATEEDEVIFDYPDPSGFHSSDDARMMKLSRLTESMGETMTGGFTDLKIDSLLKENDLKIKEHLDPDTIERKWFRNDNRIDAFPCIHLILAGK